MNTIYYIHTYIYIYMFVFVFGMLPFLLLSSSWRPLGAFLMPLWCLQGRLWDPKRVLKSFKNGFQHGTKKWSASWGFSRCSLGAVLGVWHRATHQQVVEPELWGGGYSRGWAKTLPRDFLFCCEVSCGSACPEAWGLSRLDNGTWPDVVHRMQYLLMHPRVMPNHTYRICRFAFR